MRFVLVALVVVLAGSAIAAPPAGNQKTAARNEWKQGATAYEKGHFDVAIQRFEKAYELDPSPIYLFNLGQAYRKKGDAPHALENLRAYLEKKPDAPNRALVEDLIRELEPKVAPSPAPTPAPAPAPPPRIVASPAAPPPLVVTATPEAKPRPWTHDGVGLVLAGGGVLATGAGVVMLFHSSGLRSDAESTVDEDQALDKNSSAGTFRTAGLVVTGIGVAALTAGIVKLFVLRETPRGEVQAAVSAAPGWIAVSGVF